jgi:predicted dehydrogenase
MVRFHPQWQRARELVRSGRIGELRAIQVFFSYYNDDPENIRNVPAFGGGGLMDIGCYLVLAARLAFASEPRRVVAAVEVDPAGGTDVLTSAILEFPAGHAVFTCSTRMAPYQRVHVLGDRGRIELVVPFNAPPDRPTLVLVDDGSGLFGEGVETIEVPPADQYTIQGDLFSRAVREGTPLPFPLEESVRMMEVVDALFASARSGAWVAL